MYKKLQWDTWRKIPDKLGSFIFIIKIKIKSCRHNFYREFFWKKFFFGFGENFKVNENLYKFLYITPFWSTAGFTLVDVSSTTCCSYFFTIFNNNISSLRKWFVCDYIWKEENITCWSSLSVSSLRCRAG